MADLVSWDTAARVASRIARQHPGLSEYEWRCLEADFEEMTAKAEDLVSAETGLRSLAGPARPRVADRAQWVQANVASFERLLRPVISKLAERADATAKWSPIPAQVTRQAAGVELGLLLGWLSGRVLGQYDQLLIEDERPEEQDIVYYVGPNIVSIERRYGFPPDQFRLWIALHEVTHRLQFTGVPWLRDHFLGLVERTLGSIEPDPRQLAAALKRTVERVRAGENPLEDGGIVTLLAGPEQYEAIRQIGGMMSLLEGHGDVTMDRAGRDLIPDAARFSRVLSERRRQRGSARLLAVLIGLDAKLRQYEMGEHFIAAVEDAGGQELFRRVWEGPEWLPSIDEIRTPDLWIDRARLAGAAAALPG